MKTLGPTKRRDTHVYFGCAEKFDRFDYNQSDQSFVVPDDGKLYFIFHQREYSRERKPKIIYALFQFFGARSIKQDAYDELRKYDHVFAIDTNYSDRAVTTALIGNWSKSKQRLNVKKLFTRSFLPKTSKPEREAWKSLIEQVKCDQIKKYTLIVDSDLGELSRINQRKIAVSENFLLPDNWQLNYATSDVRDDFAIVRMMRECDQSKPYTAGTDHRLRCQGIVS